MGGMGRRTRMPVLFDLPRATGIGVPLPMPPCSTPIDMPVFTYNASDPAAENISGTIAADTPRQARDLLRERGLTIRDIRTYQPATASKAPRMLTRGSH